MVTTRGEISVYNLEDTQENQEPTPTQVISPTSHILASTVSSDERMLGVFTSDNELRLYEYIDDSWVPICSYANNVSIEQHTHTIAMNKDASILALSVNGSCTTRTHMFYYDAPTRQLQLLQRIPGIHSPLLSDDGVTMVAQREQRTVHTNSVHRLIKKEWQQTTLLTRHGETPPILAHASLPTIVDINAHDLLITSYQQRNVQEHDGNLSLQHIHAINILPTSSTTIEHDETWSPRSKRHLLDIARKQQTPATRG